MLNCSGCIEALKGCWDDTSSFCYRDIEAQSSKEGVKMKYTAKELAEKIFKYNLEIEELPEAENLQCIADIINRLNNVYRNYPVEVAKDLKNLLENYVSDNLLCPECYSKTELKIISKATLYDEDGIVYCTNEHCNWTN